MKHESRIRGATSRQRGFTLVEIMVVIVILSLLATIVGTNVMGSLFRSEEDTARLNVINIDKAIETYMIQNRGRRSGLPTLEDLITPDERTNQPILKGFTEVPKDPWGNEYEVRQGETANTWEVLCAGPDGAMDTEDDISSKSAKDKKE